MSLISVDEALRRVLASIERPVETERLPLGACAGRSLAEGLTAARTQPPFPASAMDGYAVRSADCAAGPARLALAGTSAAGRRFARPLEAGEAVRIFTGAPVPEGADAVVPQEEAEAEPGFVLVSHPPKKGQFVRPAGLDFTAGSELLPAGTRLDARTLPLAAAMGHAELDVRRRPRVAILATGTELVRPGEPTGPDQIVASNPFALAALVAAAGGEPVDLGIAQDNMADTERGILAARESRADLLVTLGGASVGEHDLVQSALVRQGMELGFWRVALRPGKPLLHGRLGPMVLLGLPGNPVSSVVCAVLFVIPALRALVGDPLAGRDPTEGALLGADLPANDARQDYLRASLAPDPSGFWRATAFRPQDSSMLSTLARSAALIVRAPHAPAAKAGEPCRIIRLEQHL